jgi:RecB family exonuclease
MSQLTFSGFGNEPEAAAGVPGGQAGPIPVSPVEIASWYKGRVLSHSSISTYRACPQKWKFRYVDRIPEKPRSFFSFGKSVHAGLEFLFTKRAEMPTLEAMLDHFRGQWLREGYESPAQEKWFFQEGERILKGFYAKHQAESARVLEVELKFTINVEGVPVMGYIDRVDATPKGGLAIVDYKTGKAFDKSRVRNDPQLTLYQIACSQLFGKPVETVTLYHLNSLTPLTVPAHTPKMEDDVRTMVVEAARGISESKFEATPDERGVCQYCDYAQICPALAARKKAAPSAASEPMAALADRFGKLDARIRELEAERAETGESLRAHMRLADTNRVEGQHFAVELKPGAGERSLSVEPVPPAEGLPS